MAHTRSKNNGIILLIEKDDITTYARMGHNYKEHDRNHNANTGFHLLMSCFML